MGSHCFLVCIEYKCPFFCNLAYTTVAGAHIHQNVFKTAAQWKAEQSGSISGNLDRFQNTQFYLNFCSDSNPNGSSARAVAEVFWGLGQKPGCSVNSGWLSPVLRHNALFCIVVEAKLNVLISFLLVAGNNSSRPLTLTPPNFLPATALSIFIMPHGLTTAFLSGPVCLDVFGKSSLYSCA